MEEKTFPEPRLVLFGGVNSIQGFVVAEGEIIFEVEDFCLMNGLLYLLASYYVFHVSYPKSSIAAGVLLFLQEVILNKPDDTIKKTSKYRTLINSVIR